MGRSRRAFSCFAFWFSCFAWAWFCGCFVGVPPCGSRRGFKLHAEETESVESAPSLDCITPIGPFSPFRSSACSFDSELGKGMTDLTTSSPEFAVEMSRMQLDMQMGREPEPQRMRTLADGLEASHQKWQELMTRLQLSAWEAR